MSIDNKRQQCLIDEYLKLTKKVWSRHLNDFEKCRIKEIDEELGGKMGRLGNKFWEMMDTATDEKLYIYGIWVS